MRVIDDLNKDWLFKKNIEVTDKLIIDESFDMINVPHTYNGFDGQDGGNDYYKGKILKGVDVKTLDIYYNKSDNGYKIKDKNKVYKIKEFN